MQRKTIEKAIKNKLTEWLESITDEGLRQKVEDNLLVSGGSITSLFLGEEVNDYDIYLQDMNVLGELVLYYVKPFKDSIEILDGRDNPDQERGDENKSFNVAVRTLKADQIKLHFRGQSGYKCETTETKYSPAFFSPNAISLTDNVQIVIRFHGTPEEIHKTFDFIHATNYFTFKEGLVTNIAALESILTKQLRYQGSYYPVTSIIRAKKFIKRGWNVNAGELLKIMFQISQLDLTKPDILEEQLIGVDVAYFDLLITALRNKFDSDPNFVLSTEYFNKLVDKIFNEAD